MNPPPVRNQSCRATALSKSEVAFLVTFSACVRITAGKFGGSFVIGSRIDSGACSCVRSAVWLRSGVNALAV